MSASDLSRIEELKRQWLAMMDAVDDPLVILGADYRIIRQNRAYLRSASNEAGLSIREVPGERCYEVFAGRTAPCAHCKLQQALSGQGDTQWTTAKLFEGREHDIRVHPLPDEPAQAVVHYRDITQLRSLQEGLARADKLSALGKLAGGVAHEINSPLAGILAFAQMALQEMPEADPHKSDLREIEAAARKCKVIVEGLLGFARQEGKQDDADAICDLIETLAGTLRLAAPLIRKQRVSVAAEDVDALEAGKRPDPPDSLMVRGSAGKLGQVFLNLVTNALYAMKEGGGQLGIRVLPTPEKVTVEVEDTGTGIAPAHLQAIFDPFFTTKPVGEGTGLGLSISYSIVKQFGGEIRVRSEVGSGTVFTVILQRIFPHP